MSSPENYQGNQRTDKIVEGNNPLSPEELKELEARFAVGKTPTAAIGALAVSAALSGGMAPEAYAQQAPTPERQVQPESAERAMVRSGVAQHPELGLLTIQVYRKTVDMNNPTFGGNMYGVLINGIEMPVITSKFMKNGAGIVEFKNAKGEIGKLLYPSAQNAMNGEKSQYFINNGTQSLVIENR